MTTAWWVETKIKKRLEMSKKEQTGFIWRGSISRLLNKVEGKEQYRI
jgi:hypothetical protein